MKKTILLFALLFPVMIVSLELNAQEEPVVAGGNATGENGRVSYSVGQVDFLNVTAGSGMITQGLQQPYEIFKVGLQDNQDIHLKFSAYPNPAEQQVYLKVENLNPAGLFFEIYDQNGRFLVRNELAGEITPVPLQEFNSAAFTLKVCDKKAELISFKIIKK